MYGSAQRQPYEIHKSDDIKDQDDQLGDKPFFPGCILQFGDKVPVIENGNHDQWKEKGTKCHHKKDSTLCCGVKQGKIGAGVQYQQQSQCRHEQGMENV